MKKYRKPYLSLFLSCLILFISCEPQELSQAEKDAALKSFAKQQIAVSSKLSHMFTKEDYSRMSKINDHPEVFHSRYELAKYFKSLDLDNSVMLANAIFNIQDITNEFIMSNEWVQVLSQQQISELITDEVQAEIDKLNDLTTGLSHGPCGEALRQGEFRCNRNYTIALAGLAVSAFFTFGVGTVIGAGVAATVHAICRNDVWTDFSECVENQQ